MTLVISKGITLRKGWQPMDADAAAYITAVETADTEPLEEKTKIAIDNFVLGCKADGTWNAIKASCILAGARTLTGALVPLVGAAPTNVGGLFVSGDYNRKAGLKGDGSTKALNSNRACNADAITNNHLTVYSTEVNTNATDFSRTYIGAISAGLITRQLATLSANLQDTVFSHDSTPFSIGPVPSLSGFFGYSRTGSASNARTDGVNYPLATPGATEITTNTFVFGRGASDRCVNARLAFYSIGESLDLALLDARVTDLINAIGAAIP